MFAAARPSPSLFLLVALATAAIGGCRRDVEAENRAEREANAKRVTADSTADASAPIVDTDYQFRLTLPGRGWKLLREQDAARLNPDAVAGALSGSGDYGYVAVERLPGTTLDQVYPSLWVHRAANLVVEADEDIVFQGVPAKRRSFTATVDGLPFRYVTTVFVNRDHVYQLVSWTPLSRPSEPLIGFHEAFELLDGEVQGRYADTPAIEVADGVGWRIRGGQYEGALSGLRLRPPEGWRFVVDYELEQLSAEADIGLLHARSSVFVLLTAQRAEKQRLEPLAAARRVEFLSGQTESGGPSSADVVDQKVEFRRFREDLIDYTHGVYVGDDAITELMIWYPSVLAEEAAAPITALLASLAKLPTRERSVLRDELLAESSGSRRIGQTRAFRAGEFLDFEHDLRWAQPPGFWRIYAFEQALAYSPTAVLLARELETGVLVVLEVLDADAPDPVAAFDPTPEGYEVLDHDTALIDGVSVRRARAVDRAVTPPQACGLVSARDGDRMISLLAWAEDAGPGSWSVIDAALAGLHFAPDLVPSAISDGTYTDLHFGGSFALPSRFAGPPETRDLGLGHLAGWSTGDEAISYLAVEVPPHMRQDAEWATSFFEQTFRDAMSAGHPLGEPKRSPGRLGSYGGRRLSWNQDGRQVVGDILVDDGVVYALTFVDVPADQAAAVRESWALLE